MILELLFSMDKTIQLSFDAEPVSFHIFITIPVFHFHIENADYNEFNDCVGFVCIFKVLT